MSRDPGVETDDPIGFSGFVSSLKWGKQCYPLLAVLWG